MNDSISPTRFQQAVLRFRAHANIMNAGGRGSGKSFSLILDLLDHCRGERHGDPRPLVLRESWAGLQELQTTVHEMVQIAFPNVSRNKAEGTITLPNAVITFCNIGDETSYAKLQGRTFTALYADEVGNYPPQAFAFMQRVRSNLRVAPGERAHVHMTANPHGRSHTKIVKGFIHKAPAWHPYIDDAGDRWVWTTSDLSMNPHIDREQYQRQLTAATAGDAALAEAWIKGSWDVLGGVMFDVFDSAKHIVEPPSGPYNFCIGADWGTASPSTAILLGRLKQDIGPYRTGDVFALDEIDTAYPDDLSQGNGASVHSWAEMLKEMMNRNAVRNVMVIQDDARGLAGDTVCAELRNHQISASRPVRKDRVGHWATIRSMLQNSANGEKAGLFFSARCANLLQTLPEAPRGPLRPEDLDPKWNEDHWCDALAYGVRHLHTQRVTVGRTTGHY